MYAFDKRINQQQNEEIVFGKYPVNQVVCRSSAAEEDTIWVSGFPGSAAAGLGLCRQGLRADTDEMRRLVDAHLDPVPRCELGRRLAEDGLVHAMLDVSDGLASGSWERRLLIEFGQAYREYQRCVPRLIPWRGRCYRPQANLGTS